MLYTSSEIPLPLSRFHSVSTGNLISALQCHNMQTYAVTRPISAVNEAVLAVLHLFHFMSNNHVWSLHVFFFHVRFFPATCPFMYSLYLRMCINVHILSHCLFMCLLSSLCIATIQCSRALLKVLCFFTGLGSFSFMFTSHTFGFFFLGITVHQRGVYRSSHS